MARAPGRGRMAALLAAILFVLPIALAGHAHAGGTPPAATCAACKVTHETPVDLCASGGPLPAPSIVQLVVHPAMMGSARDATRILHVRGPPGPSARATL